MLVKEEDKVEDTSFTKEDKDSTISNKPKQCSFLVCYHLPISLILKPDTKKYAGQWSNSLISFSEGGDVTIADNTH